MNKKVTIYQDINHLSESYGQYTETKTDSDCEFECGDNVSNEITTFASVDDGNDNN